MALKAPPLPSDQVIYPTSDGQPMADNTKQFRWIVTIQGGLDALYKDNPDVFVAGDLLWYPVEGQPNIRRAPDAMVVFGRPKGDRGSYLQWHEEGIAPQVVFEVLSPSNSFVEMLHKQQFYDRYGVAEYYVYDPDNGELAGWLRREGRLASIENIDGWRSPRLGIRLSLHEGDLLIERPDGGRFLSYLELERQRAAERERAEIEHARAEAERERAEVAQATAAAAQATVAVERATAQAERERAEAEHARAEVAQATVAVERATAQAERERAEIAQATAAAAQATAAAEHARAEIAQATAAAERQRAELLAARLRALGVDLDD